VEQFVALKNAHLTPAKVRHATDRKARNKAKLEADACEVGGGGVAIDKWEVTGYV